MKRALCLAAAFVMAVGPPPPAGARECRNAVVVGLPGVTWSDIARTQPPHLLDLVAEGASGSVAVRTNSARTTYNSGFATIGAGTRMDAPKSVGLASPPSDAAGKDLEMKGLDEMEELAREEGYSTARPGALASALEDRTVAVIGSSSLGFAPPAPVGVDRPALLAGMDGSGVVDVAAVGPSMLRANASAPFGVETDQGLAGDYLEQVLADPCAVVVLDPGDLIRAETLAGIGAAGAEKARAEALLSADEQIGAADVLLGPEDLLIVVTVTSPQAEDDTHLGIAVATGEGFGAREELVSASTRKGGFVTLPDVAPTVLDFLGVERPASMLGRPWSSNARDGDPVAEGIELDEESVFSYGVQPGIATGFVIAQVTAYIVLSVLFSMKRRGKAVPDRVPARALEAAALAFAAFPLASYLAGAGPTHELGLGGFVGLLLGVDAMLVCLSLAALRTPLDRLLAIAAATLLVMVGDLLLGEALQLNAVFGNSPIVAGRFAGLGNLAFSILGASALVTATIVVHKKKGHGGLVAAAAIFAFAVAVDGAPSLGSDVGGVLALVPGFALTWILLSGHRITLRAALLAAVAGVVALGLFLLVDLARPEDSRTHLARLAESVREQGAGAFADTIGRKVRTNLRIFTSTIWTYLVPPALLLLGILLRRPPGRWEELARRFPEIRSGLVGGLVLALLGFAVNDSGIVVPAMFLSWLVPMALVAYVALETSESA